MLKSWPWSARIGLVAWAAGMIFVQPAFEVAALAFAPCVIVPIALSLVAERLTLFDRLFLAVVQRLVFFAAMLVLGSLLFVRTGSLGAALVVPWLGVTAALALIGLRRLQRGEWRRANELGITAGLAMIAVGGGWLVVSRLGMRPQNFPDEIVFLTSVHFHYAAFALPILAAITAEALPGRPSMVAVTLIALGVPLTGVGFSLSRHIEIVAVIMLVIGCGLIAVQQLRDAFTQRNPTAMILLAFSAISLATAMVPALLYGWGKFTGSQSWTLAAMIASHGMLNAFGFALCGLTGRRL